MSRDFIQFSSVQHSTRVLFVSGIVPHPIHRGFTQHESLASYLNAIQTTHPDPDPQLHPHLCPQLHLLLEFFPDFFVDMLSIQVNGEILPVQFSKGRPTRVQGSAHGLMDCTDMQLIETRLPCERVEPVSATLL